MRALLWLVQLVAYSFAIYHYWPFGQVDIAAPVKAAMEYKQSCIEEAKLGLARMRAECQQERAKEAKAKQDLIAHVKSMLPLRGRTRLADARFNGTATGLSDTCRHDCACLRHSDPNLCDWNVGGSRNGRWIVWMVRWPDGIAYVRLRDQSQPVMATRLQQFRGYTASREDLLEQRRQHFYKSNEDFCHIIIAFVSALLIVAALIQIKEMRRQKR